MKSKPAAATLFDLGPPPKTKRAKPRKLMHVVDAGPCDARDYDVIVAMQCNRCDLRTDWFAMPNVTSAKRGIPCPHCSGVEFEVNEYSEYVVPAGDDA